MKSFPFFWNFHSAFEYLLNVGRQNKFSKLNPQTGQGKVILLDIGGGRSGCHQRGMGGRGGGGGGLIF